MINTRLLSLLLLILLIPVSSQADNEQDTWTNIQNLQQSAESKVQQNKNDDAMVSLRAALDQALTLQYSSPKWNNSVVRNNVKNIKQRIYDIEQLILLSIKNFSKDQLIEKLKESKISSAKFSKAMMILHKRLQYTKKELTLKKSELNEAQSAAQSSINNHKQVEKMSFELLKIKGKLNSKSALIKSLKAQLMEAAGTDEFKKELEQQQIFQQQEARKFQKTINTQQQEHLANKQRLRELSKKFSTLKYKESSLNSKVSESAISSKKWRKMALELKAGNDKLKANYDNSKNKLAYSLKQIAKLQKSEQHLIASLKNNNNAALAQVKENDILLAQENNHLKQTSIDLKTKWQNSDALATRIQKRLEDHIKKNTPLINELVEIKANAAVLQKKFTLHSQRLALTSTKNKQLNQSLSQLEKVLKIQQDINESNRKKLVVALANQRTTTSNDVLEAQSKQAKVTANNPSTELLTAYAKNEKELKAKLHFSISRITELEKQVSFIKNETLSGNEEIIAKYVKARDELKDLQEENLALKSASGNTVKNAKDTRPQQNMPEEKIHELLFQAHTAQQNQQLQVAIGTYNEILKINKNHFETLLNLGLIYYNQGHFQDACTQLKRAFYINPDHSHLLLALGVAQLQQNNISAALSSLSRLISIEPKNSQARLQLGAALQAIGWVQAALGQYKKAFELDAISADAAFNIAVCNLALSTPNIPEARKYYNIAIKLGIVRDQTLEKYFEKNK